MTRNRAERHLLRDVREASEDIQSRPSACEGWAVIILWSLVGVLATVAGSLAFVAWVK